MARAHGIDISHNQGSFDPGAKPEDVHFVIIRASNGTTKDRKFDEFAAKAGQIPVRGAYHYFRSEISPVQEAIGVGRRYPWKDQADLFLELVQDKDFHFFVLDYESNTIQGHLDNTIDEKFDQDFQKWLNYVGEHTGKPTIIYSNVNWYKAWMNNWPFWLAQWWALPDRNNEPNLPDHMPGWKLWQYSAEVPPNLKGHEYGVGSDNVDLNVYNGTISDMQSWLQLDLPDDGQLEEPIEDELVVVDERSVITWRDVIVAARNVAAMHDAVYFTWFRESGMADQVLDESLYDQPYDGLDIEDWTFTGAVNRNQIISEIHIQLLPKSFTAGQTVSFGAGLADLIPTGLEDGAPYRWLDLIRIARDVANQFGASYVTWFREAGMKNQILDETLYGRPYDGVPPKDWQIPVAMKNEILQKLDQLLGKQRPDQPSPVDEVLATGSTVKLDVPFMSQWDPLTANLYSTDCGPTCLAMMLNAQPSPIRRTVNEIYQRHLSGLSDNNTTYPNLKKVFKQEGFEAESKVYTPRGALRGMRSFIRRGRPMLILVNYDKWNEYARKSFAGSHFVLVTGFDEDHVFVHDPLFRQGDNPSGAFFPYPNKLFLEGWGGFSAQDRNPNFSRLETSKVVPFLES